MHTFQKKDKTVLTMNPFDKIGKQWMLITSGDEDKANTMTASWGGVGVLWGSDVVYIFVRQSRYTKEFIDKTGHFSISFLGEEYRKALQHLGTVSGRDGDKISEAGVSVAYENGIPYIDEAELCLPVQHFLQQILLWIRCWMQKLSQNGMRMAIFIRCMLGRLKRY